VKKSKIAINLALALIVATGAWFTLHQEPATTQASIPSRPLLEQLPSFSLQDTEGVVRNSSEWDGKILVVNFWATWCPPCVEEMPILLEFQDQYSSHGVQVVGVAVDNLEQVKDFMDFYGINFPVLVGSEDAIALAQKMGNRISALPYTAIFSQTGKTIYAQPGKITEETLKKAIRPLL